jgi:hypothetical protein
LTEREPLVTSRKPPGTRHERLGAKRETRGTSDKTQATRDETRATRSEARDASGIRRESRDASDEGRGASDKKRDAGTAANPRTAARRGAGRLRTLAQNRAREQEGEQLRKAHRSASTLRSQEDTAGHRDVKPTLNHPLGMAREA